MSVSYGNKIKSAIYFPSFNNHLFTINVTYAIMLHF